MLDTIKNIHKKYGMKTQLSMLSNFNSGFPTESFYLNCILELISIKQWKSNTLIKIVNKHAINFAEALAIRLSTGNFKDSEKIIKNATVKFKGNLLEIIVEKLCQLNMFCDRFKICLDHVIGSDNDEGIDIMMYYRDNPSWKVGMQIKFRTIEEIDYKSGALSKTSDIIRRSMEEDLITGKITADNYIDWIKNCPIKLILVTTTDANYKVKTIMNDLDVVNGDILFDMLYKNATFWNSLLKDIEVEIANTK